MPAVARVLPLPKRNESHSENEVTGFVAASDLYDGLTQEQNSRRA